MKWVSSVIILQELQKMGGGEIEHSFLLLHHSCVLAFVFTYMEAITYNVLFWSCGTKERIVFLTRKRF